MRKTSNLALDRYATQDKRAAEVIARERKRDEKRRNSLPPFLMVRSGLFNGWFVTLGALILAASSSFFSMQPSEYIWPDIAAGGLAFSGICYGMISTEKKRSLLKQDIENIRDEFNRYIYDPNYSVYLIGKVYSSKLAKILIRDITAHNPYVFDKMIKDPDTITDSETQSHIISGYLRKYPSDAQKVIDTFKPEQIDPKVYNTALTYVTRLKNSEKIK